MIFLYRIAPRKLTEMEGRNDKFVSEAAPIEPPRSRLYSLRPEGIRQATLMLYSEGINPSAKHVTKKLSDSGFMRTPEGLTAWHAARYELGLE